ncbi:oxidoreductase [Nocardia aurantiaca]|uniref:SDR family NAD(P)-dependent oxidoreductase n=1 Tax=Nocardia aurantiaca TaxID=2675850 RepID=A0A6I3KU47_9NOCA|nr:oxidoreductase [Nocardia aurantiaca]MTE14333.1 SDR family NAD(P)-dependent oxidoreductase [Nocardia aurantiaca]
MSERTRPWTVSEAGSQAGRVAVVTGANTGIGLEIARQLATADATVVLACRDQGRADAARADILGSAPKANVYAVQVDMGSLDSIAACSRRLRENWPVIDLLINNAGVMAAAPTRTADGFESDFGTNFLGHFALTGHLLDRVRASPSGRVVTVSSITHRRRTATLDFEDPNGLRRFDPATAYARSKMASMTFMVELQRRLAATGERTLSVAAHPGGVRTHILRQQNRLIQLVYNPRLSWLTGWFTQSPADGARPILRAALDSSTRGGDFYGPAGRGELVGPPVLVEVSRRARDVEAGRRLWQLAEDMTGVRFLETHG